MNDCHNQKQPKDNNRKIKENDFLNRSHEIELRDQVISSLGNWVISLVEKCNHFHFEPPVGSKKSINPIPPITLLPNNPVTQ
jgi:hypothetical protein